MTEEFNYEEDLNIDSSQLDVELLEQPQLFMKYSRASAHAKKRAKRAHEKVKTNRSELIKKAREAGAKNQQQEEAYYRTRKSYKKLKKLMILREYEADVLEGAVFAFHQRKVVLETLCQLHGQEYFSEPKAKGALGERHRERVEATRRSEAVEKLKKKKVKVD